MILEDNLDLTVMRVALIQMGVKTATFEPNGEGVSRSPAERQNVDPRLASPDTQGCAENREIAREYRYKQGKGKSRSQCLRSRIETLTCPLRKI